MWIDAHAHLCNSDFTEDLEHVLARAQDAGVTNIVNICTNPEELERGVALAKRTPWIYTVGATTPHGAEEHGSLDFEFFASSARKGDLVAIGETGFDYHYYAESASIQQELLRRYFRLALECDLPVVIHCREAFADFFRILDEEYVVDGKHGPGVLHCFTGNWDEAQELIARGWFISFSGIVTFKKSQELQKIAQAIPLKHLMLETDSPYLAPVTRRGKKNEPAYVVETAKIVADLRGISLEELAQATTHNVRNLFRF